MPDDYLGQLFILGFSGKGLSAEFEDFYGRESIGGVILLDRNFDSLPDLRRLIGSVGSLSEIAPFVMIDQEVRGVNRIGENMPTLSEEHLASSEVAPRQVQEAFSQTATILEDLGINVQLAPVVDLFGEAQSQVLRGRCFGRDPGSVAQLAAIAVRSIQSAGISSCAKHFPGLGKAEADPHLELARVEISKRDWSQQDALPFKRAISEGVDLIMSTHMICSALDRSSPATFSKTVIEGCLKRELGFEGLVITDDLTMKAIGERDSVPKAALNALNAGHHLLLICEDFETQEEALDLLRKAYLSRQLNRSEVDRSISRILEFKRRYDHS